MIRGFSVPTTVARWPDENVLVVLASANRGADCKLQNEHCKFVIEMDLFPHHFTICISHFAFRISQFEI